MVGRYIRLAKAKNNVLYISTTYIWVKALDGTLWLGGSCQKLKSLLGLFRDLVDLEDICYISIRAGYIIFIFEDGQFRCRHGDGLGTWTTTWSQDKEDEVVSHYLSGYVFSY